MSELKLLDDRIKNLTTGLLGMADSGTMQVSKAFLESVREYMVELLALRRAQPDNVPLTLEELRGMVGEPVLVETPNKSKSEWVFVKQVRDNGDVRVRPDFHSCINLPYSKVRFYRRKPEPEGGA